MSNRHVVMIPIVALGLVIAFIAILLQKPTASSSNADGAPSSLQGGLHHKPLLSDTFELGLNQPAYAAIDQVDLVDSTPVIGIEVDGQAIGFVVERMEDPKAHILNFNFNEKKSISVTYCNLADCVRVLSDDRSRPIPLHVGGLDVDQQLVFLLQGERYSQLSPDLPLEDHPFLRTTLGDWKQQYPQTKVCIPPSRVSIEHRKRGPSGDSHWIPEERTRTLGMRIGTAGPLVVVHTDRAISTVRSQRSFKVSI